MKISKSIPQIKYIITLKTDMDENIQVYTSD